MDTQTTLGQLSALKLQGMAHCYQTILEQPAHHLPDTHTTVAMLAQAESEHRLNARTQLYLRLSKLRYHALVEQVKVSPERGLSKEQLISFCEGTFIERAQNILISGSTGAGKSFLACALGRKACTLGYRTLYYSMNRFVEALAQARLDGSYLKWLNQLAKTPLLILDDFGLVPLDHQMKLTLLQILEDRYGVGATIITSQLPVKAWYEYIQEPSLADAILDRLTAQAHRIELKGESMRKKKNN
jgi:DNA replication protein DnaC